MSPQQTPDDPPPTRPHPARASFLPPEVMEIMKPSLQVGAAAGGVGLFVGGLGGIMTASKTPMLFSLISGGQWFVLGSGYYAARRTVISAWGGDQKLTQGDLTKASTIAGGCAGALGGMLRGPRNILPAALVFSLLGAGGQVATNVYSRRASATVDGKKSWLDAKWSPLTRISDEDFEKRLEEQILKLDAEIAIIDEGIAAIRSGEMGGKTNEADTKPPGTKP